jgi:ectoine hydroxylase-related dioxygenase (phytanoyl-CoA dioxygenase family)
MTSPTLMVHVDYPDAGLLRPVTDEEREAYEKDGAAILKGIIPAEWVEYMRDAVDRLLARSEPSSQNYADEGKPRFFAQAFPWLSDEGFKAWAIYGPLKDLARQVMSDVKGLNFFYDQIFVKEPGATKATPWHQDFPYLPIRGSQILRIWVPFDVVSAEGGAVRYLKGSHNWGVVYHPIGFKAIPAITDAYVDSPYVDQPDFDAEYERYDWLVGEAEPGDALLHHPMTVHGSPGNTTGNFRRAVTSIYTGDQVTWNPHSANMFNNKDLTGHVEMPDLPPGGPVDSALFPRVWPEVQTG